MILCLLGSASKDSVTRMSLSVVEERLREKGEKTELLDLSLEFTAMHDIDDYDEPVPGGQTALLRERVAAASGFVLASPVYHGTFSGRLKNALDHLEGDAFTGQAVGVLAAGGGPRSASVACDHMRTVVRALSGWTTPTHVATTSGDFASPEELAGLVGRVDDLVEELCSFRYGSGV